MGGSLLPVYQRVFKRWMVAFATILGLTATLLVAAPADAYTSYTDCRPYCEGVSNLSPQQLAQEILNRGAASNPTSILDNEIRPLATTGVPQSANCTVDVRLLQMLVIIERKYGGIYITDINRPCIGSTLNCSYSPHCLLPAKAVDMTSVGGRSLTGYGNDLDIDLLKFVDTFVPPNTYAEQKKCRAGVAHSFTNIVEFDQTECDHQHIDFGHTSEALRLPAANRAPIGAFDSLSTTADGSFTVRGWVIDQDTPGTSAQLEVWADGTRLGVIPTTVLRTDVNNAYGVGGNHGFEATFAVNPGAHTVGLNALDTSDGSKAGLGVKSVTVGGTKPTSDRISGGTRYDGAAAVSQAGFPTTAPVVYIASGENAVDAVYAGPAAAKAGGPLLLTAAAGLPDPTRSELTRLQPSRVVFVGGTAVIPDAQLTSVQQLLPNATVVRRSGADRFEAARATIRGEFTSAPVVFVVDSNSWTDAISAGNIAAYNGEPVMIVNGPNASVDPADASLLRDLGTTTVRVIGGSASVSDAMLNSLASVVPNTARLAGSDRFATAALAAQRTYGSTHPSTAYLVSGENYPDGLTSAGFTGRSGGPILLARAGCVPQSTLATIYSLHVSKVTLIGGATVLTSDVGSLTPCGV